MSTRNSILIGPSRIPTVIATVNITNTDYTRIIDIVSGITTTTLQNGILLRNYGISNILIYSTTAVNNLAEISIIPNESIFIKSDNIDNIQVKTSAVSGSVLGIIAN